MVLGEGAAMLVLEPLDAALARGARPLAEMVGFGMSADAVTLRKPVDYRTRHAMRSALRDAGLAPEQIGYINAHGTATEANDRTEVAAIRCVLIAMPTGSRSVHEIHAWNAPARPRCWEAVPAFRSKRRHASSDGEFSRSPDLALLGCDSQSSTRGAG